MSFEYQRKPFYSVDEAAEMLQISAGGLYQKIEQGKVEVRRIGKRILVPETYIFGEDAKKARLELQEQGGAILETVKPEFIKLLEGAPEYGSCGITITFHAGKVTRISTQTEISRLAPAPGGAA